MLLSSNEKLWNFILKMPMTRWMLEATLRKCSDCGRTRLETALDDYARQGQHKCVSCSICSSVIRFWIDSLRKSLVVDERRVLKLVGDPFCRRAMKSVIRGFLDFGLNRPLSVGAPLLVVWNFTYRCNLKCKHCYLNSGEVFKRETTTKDAIRLVDKIADFGVTSLAFSGGEPFVRKDFFEIAKHAVDSGLYVSVATNGTLLDEKKANILKRIGVHYVEVSVDGADAKIHDDFRGVKGAFSKALEGIKACVKEEVCTCFAVTVTKHNLKEVPEVFNIAKEVGARRFTLFNFIPTGRGKEIIGSDPSPTEREEVLRFLNQKLLEDSGLAILTTTPQLARVAIECSTQQEVIMPLAHMDAAKVNKKAQTLAQFIGGCGAGRFYCAISPEGLVQPCVFLPITVGDLRTEEFHEIWHNSRIFNVLRDRRNLKGRCGRCEFRYVCGGCRARAFAYFNDYLAPDPGCIREIREPTVQEELNR